MERTDRKTAKVYAWYDDSRIHAPWHYDLTPPEGVTCDQIDVIELPEHYDLYVAESGIVYAYDTRTEPREPGTYHDAWEVRQKMRHHYVMCDAHRDSDYEHVCRIVASDVGE